jgi:hypothetical protein
MAPPLVDLTTLNSAVSGFSNVLETTAQQVTAANSWMSSKEQEVASLNGELAKLKAASNEAPFPYSIVMSNLERLPWKQAGDSGLTGGGSTSTASGGFSFAPGTANPITPAIFKINPTKSWWNSYWFQKFERDFDYVTVVRNEAKFMFPKLEDLVNCNALEIEAEQSTGSLTWNYAWQLRPAKDGKSGSWYVFNNIGTDPKTKWEYTGLSQLLTPGQWYHAVMDFVRSVDNATHIGIAVDGKWHGTNLQHGVEKVSGGKYISVGHQLDGREVPKPCTCLLLDRHLYLG